VALPETADITGLLKAWRAGDEQALERLVPMVYPHLRAQAQHHMRREPSGITLQTTALVHEVYLRLINAHDVDWQDRIHFFALSAQIMRRVLVDAARARHATKRGGGDVRVAHAEAFDFDRLPSAASDAAASVCALNDALQRLAELDPRRAKVIELRFFGGLTVEETAEVLGVSPQTVMRDWRLARAWLARELRVDSPSADGALASDG
jgi:RNA polymerase sigma factor (TIGR02999 family)